MGRLAILLPLLLTGCTSVALPAGPAPFDPIAFFTGPSQGSGTLRPVVGSASAITVTSRGTPQPGGLLLVQEIRQQGKAPRTRAWTMRRLGPGRYTGTLTDAEGPVELTTSGPRATVRYRTPDGVTIRQQLALQPDGRTSSTGWRPGASAFASPCSTRRSASSRLAFAPLSR